MINSSCHEYSSSEREVFTVWMKSLVISSNGCTVFNSKGDNVFRVDNYQTGVALKSCSWTTMVKCFSPSNERFDDGVGEWFKVKRECRIPGRGMITCHVTLGCNKTGNCSYKIVGLQGKQTVKITDRAGRVLAEVMQKQSQAGGVSLGDDVLSLMVEPQIDQSLIMALVIVYGMINHKL
ncbi:UNVERIFIED_CONTAM: protein LURP-one-related 2 [Sesamum radiatum]|uniref:Protein LURP-one-related 2 n=1 Tax=Sesamum radiatum TaxID=300843 RepID=A0AAW2TXM6_SESRA